MTNNPTVKLQVEGDATFNPLSKFLVNGNTEINPVTRLDINGEGVLTSNTGQWGRSFWVKLLNPDACAYHLWSEPQGKDVFYVCEAGYIYTTRGVWVANSAELITDIEPIDNPLENLLRLNGVKFKYAGEEENPNYRMGLIAE